MKKERKEMQMKEVIVESYYLCDKCGDRIKYGLFDAFNFELEYRTGEQYPEGGSGDKYNIDLCHKCAPKLIQLLKENDYKIQCNEWDN